MMLRKLRAILKKIQVEHEKEYIGWLSPFAWTYPEIALLFVSMGKDFFDSFTRYKTWAYFKKDLKKPFQGVVDSFFAVRHLIFAPSAFLYKLLYEAPYYAFKKNNKAAAMHIVQEAFYILSAAIVGFVAGSIRGLSLIVAAPLIWVNALLRAGATYLWGARKMEENPGTQRAVQEAEATLQRRSPMTVGQASIFMKRLMAKQDKAKSRNQQFNTEPPPDVDFGRTHDKKLTLSISYQAEEDYKDLFDFGPAKKVTVEIIKKIIVDHRSQKLFNHYEIQDIDSNPLVKDVLLQQYEPVFLNALQNDLYEEQIDPPRERGPAEEKISKDREIETQSQRAPVTVSEREDDLRNRDFLYIAISGAMKVNKAINAVLAAPQITGQGKPKTQNPQVLPYQFVKHMNVADTWDGYRKNITLNVLNPTTFFGGKKDDEELTEADKQKFQQYVDLYKLKR